MGSVVTTIKHNRTLKFHGFQKKSFRAKMEIVAKFSHIVI